MESETAEEPVPSTKPAENASSEPAVITAAETADALPPPEVTPQIEQSIPILEVPSTAIPIVTTNEAISIVIQTTAIIPETATKELENTEEIEDLVTTAIVPTFVTPAKRGRGRPRKYPKPEEKPPAEKRGRGRPRKYPKTDSENKKSLTPDGQKRGRGRPRKYPLIEKKQPLPGEPKRGRGRPRKYPKKEIDPNTPKRGRGRPRKDASIAPNTISEDNTNDEANIAENLVQHVQIPVDFQTADASDSKNVGAQEGTGQIV